MEKTLLLFGFSGLPEIMAVRHAAAEAGAEIRAAGGAEWSTPLGVLAGLDSPKSTGQSKPHAAAGKMLVLCGLGDAELDRLLPALRREGISCLKAVLTPTNRSWTPERLYAALVQERAAAERR